LGEALFYLHVMRKCSCSPICSTENLWDFCLAWNRGRWHFLSSCWDCNRWKRSKIVENSNGKEKK